VSRWLVALVALGGLGCGGLLRLVGAGAASDDLFAGTAALVLVPLAWSVARSLLRRDVGVDAIALVAIAGALGLGEYLVAAVVALMLAGGNALEESANRRARRELTALVERAPRIAHRRRGDAVEEVSAGGVEAGDVVLVRAGEVVPVDGVIESEAAVVDESTLTGEPLPAAYQRATRCAAVRRTQVRSSSCARSARRSRAPMRHS
jgi:cation transport ATPase